MSEWTFTVTDAPLAKGRVRTRQVHTKDGRSFSQAYTPPHTRRAEERIRAAIRDELPAEWKPLDGPVRLSFIAMRALPASTPKRDLYTARPSTRPDLPNFAMLLADALQGVVYTDDARIVDMRCTKDYVRDGSAPRWEITVEDLT